MDANEEVKFFVKNKKNGGRVEGSGGRGQGGCERRSEVIVKIITKTSGGEGSVGVRVDVNEKLKLF